MTLMAYQITQVLVQRLLHVNKKETSHHRFAGENGRQFADDNFKRIFLNAHVWISIDISLEFIRRIGDIIWTSADPVYWRTYAAPGEDELKE